MEAVKFTITATVELTIFQMVMVTQQIMLMDMTSAGENEDALNGVPGLDCLEAPRDLIESLWKGLNLQALAMPTPGFEEVMALVDSFLDVRAEKDERVIIRAPMWKLLKRLCKDLDSWRLQELNKK
jgi:hypothetical protein